MNRKEMTLPVAVALAGVLAGVGLWLSGAISTSSQQQRPAFEGIPADVLESAGVSLTLPVQAQELLNESSAMQALDAEYRGASTLIRESALVNLRDGDFTGPVWAFSMDTTGKTEQGSDRTVGKVEWQLIFVDAATGAYVSEIRLNNYSPNGAPPSIGPMEPVDPNQPDEGAVPTPSPQ